MNKQLKQLIIVIPLCFALGGLALALNLLDPDFQVSFYMIFSTALLTTWAFFFIPALPFAINWVKNYFENVSFEQSFRASYFFGRGLGALLFFLFLVGSPITGTMWFIKTIKSLISSAKNKNSNKNDTSEIFELYS